jgi:hypothetical protein
VGSALVRGVSNQLSQVTTVFPRQGHYATDRETLAKYPHGEIQIDDIGELVNYDFTHLVK